MTSTQPAAQQRFALTHTIDWQFDRTVSLSTHWLRLRPAPHVTDQIDAWSIRVSGVHFLNSLRDAYENPLARLDLPEPIRSLRVTVETLIELAPRNPFDFLTEPYAFKYPFDYPKEIAKELSPYQFVPTPGPKLAQWLGDLSTQADYTVSKITEVNRVISERYSPWRAHSPGAIDLDDVLSRTEASPLELAWLMTVSLRQLGLAARVTSGYRLITGDSTDHVSLHAWSEVYLPGGGWVGLDPSSGVMVAEGYIPLASAPEPLRVAPVIGYVEACTEQRHETLSVRRLQPELPEWPISRTAWADIRRLGAQMDAERAKRGLSLTTGFSVALVSHRASQFDEWRTFAMGSHKRRCAEELIRRLRRRLAPAGVIQIGQGEWFGGDTLPRWRLGCFYRADGGSVWPRGEWLGLQRGEFALRANDARRFIERVAARFGIAADAVVPAHEDGMQQLSTHGAPYWMAAPDPADLRDPLRRRALAESLSIARNEPVGYVLPLRRDPNTGRWSSGHWQFRRGALFLAPGDSSMGFRLPLGSLPVGEAAPEPADPERCQFDDRPDLASLYGETEARFASLGPEVADPDVADPDVASSKPPRTALCAEIRQGLLAVFLPPLTHLEHYLELIGAIESVAAELGIQVVLEGYEPPEDHRLQRLLIEPEPGILRVHLPDVPDTKAQRELLDIVYEEAAEVGLFGERLVSGGLREAPGGRAAIRLGGERPSESPFLKRPELLRGLIESFQRHPALSYLFAGRAIGAGGDAPRPDEGRNDSLYELDIALERIPSGETTQAWMADRLLRHLLADPAGDMRRAEIRIDLLFPPDRSAMRLGRTVVRAFETAAHPRLAMLQMLLIHGLLLKFADEPRFRGTIRWDSALRDRFLLPRVLWEDLLSVLNELAVAGFPFQAEWFEPFLESRFPVFGRVQFDDIGMELRPALEPWPVLAEEVTGAGVVRFVDSANQRVQVRCTGLTPDRHAVVCNGHRVPLQPTGVLGEAVAGVRFKLYDPPSTLHPTIAPVGSLVFDLVDLWTGRVIGGCTWFPPLPQPAGPAGIAPVRPDIGSERAPDRRSQAFTPPPPSGSEGRFLAQGSGRTHLKVPDDAQNPRAPYSLDLTRLT